MNVKRVCIVGGGNLGHVIAGVLSTRQCVESVSLLTGHPERWGESLTIVDGAGKKYEGKLGKISADVAEVIPQAQVVLLCLPGTAIVPTLERIKPHLAAGTMVGSVFSSTGFFFEALKRMGDEVVLWGFQRVPYIARTIEYGHSASLKGYKSQHKIAVEHCDDSQREDLRQWVEEAFDAPTAVMGNYLEASLTNSNPLLHTSRLYTMFGNWSEGVTYDRNPGFYEEWTREAAHLYINMDAELHRLIEVLPVAPDFLPTVLDYYESTDDESLARKLCSIESFKGILSPMREASPGKWAPDFDSRYFTEDFGLSLKYIWQLVHERGIDAPNIDMVYEWGMSMVVKYSGKRV